MARVGGLASQRRSIRPRSPRRPHRAHPPHESRLAKPPPKPQTPHTVACGAANRPVRPKWLPELDGFANFWERALRLAT